MLTIAPNDPRIEYSDYVRLHKDEKVARFDRIVEAATGFTHDNPGARIRFATDAKSIFVRLCYTGEHTRLDAMNGIGVYRVDGVVCGNYQAAMRPGEAIFELTSPKDGRSHLFEVILPFGDSVEFCGMEVNPEAKFLPVPPRPATRWLAYGDSITHGFQATDVMHTYPYIVSEAMNWQMVNFAFGSHRATASDGKTIAALAPSIITILIGANDGINDKPIAAYKADCNGLLDNIRANGNITPIYFLTPLPVAGGGWNNGHERLEKYRVTVREIVGERKDANLTLVEGSTLIPADVRYFQDGLHPNDEGFSHMAAQLITLFKERPTTK